jgi:uncharacterized protein (DUF433 family)
MPARATAELRSFGLRRSAGACCRRLKSVLGITVDPEICHGQPCVRGLRYPVEFLLELLSGEMTVGQILADYPDLEANDLRAACAYGARLSRIKRVEPVAA